MFHRLGAEEFPDKGNRQCVRIWMNSRLVQNTIWLAKTDLTLLGFTVFTETTANVEIKNEVLLNYNLNGSNLASRKRNTKQGEVCNCNCNQRKDRA